MTRSRVAPDGNADECHASGSSSPWIRTCSGSQAGARSTSICETEPRWSDQSSRQSSRAGVPAMMSCPRTVQASSARGRTKTSSATDRGDSASNTRRLAVPGIPPPGPDEPPGPLPALAHGVQLVEDRRSSGRRSRSRRAGGSPGSTRRPRTAPAHAPGTAAGRTATPSAIVTTTRVASPGALRPIALHGIALHVDQLQARVQLGLQRCRRGGDPARAGTSVVQLIIEPARYRRSATRRRSTSVVAADPGARPGADLAAIACVAQLDVEAAGLAVDLPEAESDGSSAGIGPRRMPRWLEATHPRGSSSSRHGRIHGGQAQREPAAARMRARLLLPVDAATPARGPTPSIRSTAPPESRAPTAGAAPASHEDGRGPRLERELDRPGRPGADDQLRPAAEEARLPSRPVAGPDQPGRPPPAAPSAGSRRAASTSASNSRGESTRSPVPGGKYFVTSFAGTRTRTTSGPASATPPPIVRTAAHTSPIRSPARGRPASLCDAGPAPPCAVPRLLRRPDRRPATLDAFAAGLHTLKSIHFIGLNFANFTRFTMASFARFIRPDFWCELDVTRATIDVLDPFNGFEP